MRSIESVISQEISITEKRINACIALLDEGATIPFISRYRKEATDALDEVEVGKIAELLTRYRELNKRKESVLNSIDEQGKLTDELRVRIEECYSSSQLEDIYLPYKPKRRTKAQVAREKGLEPLAAMIMRQDGADPMHLAARFVKGEVDSLEQAVAGASDIIAEWVSESERARNTVRRSFAREGVITSKVIKGKETEGVKYSDYFDFDGRFAKMPSHRVLALFRAEREGVVRLSLMPDDEKCIEELDRIFLKGRSEVVSAAVKDGYKRLIKPSIESEFLSQAKERADEEAIAVFAENLRQLLLSSPLGQKRVLAIDPGFRTGCKVVCLDSQGGLLHNETIFPHAPQKEISKAMSKISSLVESYKIEAIAIGDGTAGRETEQFIKSMRFGADILVFMVSEDGASVYSASPVAREEFPQYDVTVRGAVSIGRRLVDPLSELVKIDPKSIGVGQYQHDVNQSRLKDKLDTVVESCVNIVGVNLNTASKHLLRYVSGLGESLAKNIVEYRAVNGDFTSRTELTKVPRLGAKAFEQCAGFLRIPTAGNPLDNSAVHPESYSVAQKMAKDSGVSLKELIGNKELCSKIKTDKYISDKIGIHTLLDIVNELSKPGLDPRSSIKVFDFADGIRTVDDIHEGMTLPGIVTNITNFGAFVDIGIKQDGLVHISHLADKYVSNPADVVRLHQHVMVKVIGVDKVRGRINLSMKEIS